MSIAIVTGASRGIGKECAVKLASHYDKLAITCLKIKNCLKRPEISSCQKDVTATRKPVISVIMILREASLMM